MLGMWHWGFMPALDLKFQARVMLCQNVDFIAWRGFQFDGHINPSSCEIGDSRYYTDIIRLGLMALNIPNAM